MAVAVATLVHPATVAVAVAVAIQLTAVIMGLRLTQLIKSLLAMVAQEGLLGRMVLMAATHPLLG